MSDDKELNSEDIARIIGILPEYAIDSIPIDVWVSRFPPEVRERMKRQIVSFIESEQQG